jgi:hypothetical protein
MDNVLWRANIRSNQRFIHWEVLLKLETLKSMLEAKNPLSFIGQCCCCGAESSVTATLSGGDAVSEVTITGGAAFLPPIDWHVKDTYLVKCQTCWEKDPHFYPRTEIYSRVVGYMRPVSSWHKGKQAEYKMRINYEMPT